MEEGIGPLYLQFAKATPSNNNMELQGGSKRRGSVVWKGEKLLMARKKKNEGFNSFVEADKH